MFWDVNVLVYCRKQVLRSSRGTEGETKTPKSTHDSLGIRWVLGEVAFQEVHGVIVGGAIELPSVPKIGPMRKGSLHGLDSLLGGARVWSPCKA